MAGVCTRTFFDWKYELGNPVHPGTVPAPLLSNASGSELADFLAGRATAAVRVNSPLDSSTVSSFLDGPTPLTHVLAGFENPRNGGDALTAIQIEALVHQAGATGSSGAKIGQFALDPYHPDATNPNPTSGLSDIVYSFSEVNAAMPNLFPGSSSFRSPAAANSPAPSVRSSLFTLPLTRLARVADATPTDHALLPFVARFDSFGSPLVNSEYMGLPAYETTDQHLSRGDYQALVTHYRMRGADGVIAHHGGIVEKKDEPDMNGQDQFSPYTHGDFLDDSLAGWGFLDQIYDGELTPVPLTPAAFESGGFARSGVFGQVESGKSVATFLLSNLTNLTLQIDVPSQIDGMGVVPFDIVNRMVSPGSHRLLTLWLDNNQWHLLGSGDAFILAHDTNGGIGSGRH